MTALDPVAVVHEWLTEWGGSEDVVRAMLVALPGARLYATVDFLKEADQARLGGVKARTTFLQRAPFARTRFWNYLPLTPLAVESHDLSDARLIVSSSHAFAKGALARSDQLHLSYVHSPMRYAWDLQQQYLQDYGLARGISGFLARWMFHRLRAWDRQTANNVDLFIANSRYVRQRIWRAYRRPALVLHPPVAVDRFRPSDDRSDHYVSVSRLVSYKRVDLLVEAFRAMPDRRLVVIGDGPELPRMRARCPPNVILMGWQPHDVVVRQVGTARAFLFAALEDFGISPVEAQACGTPVIAYGAGGALETVVPLDGARPPTGLFFARQSVDSLVGAIRTFESRAGEIEAGACRAWAEGFAQERFIREFGQIVTQAAAAWAKDPASVESELIRAHGA